MGLPLVAVLHPSIFVLITANYHDSMAPWAEVKSIEKDLERVIDEPGTPYELHIERFRQVGGDTQLITGTIKSGKELTTNEKSCDRPWDSKAKRLQNDYKRIQGYISFFFIVKKIVFGLKHI
jgi:hypothetical protein